MKLIMLGTGNAKVTEVYNTCFVLSEKKQRLLVDGGGGNGLLVQLKSAGIKWQEIHHIILTHTHMDHILGVVWMIRMVTQGILQGKYEGELTIYGHDEAIKALSDIAGIVLGKKENALIGTGIHLIVVKDGEECEILSHKVRFFDIYSTKVKQFGFSMYLDDRKRLTCMGDEPCNEACKAYVKGSTYLLHEAFCLYSQADEFKPYEKHHSTVLDAAKLAAELEVENLILYHTEDRTIENRARLYLKEARKEFRGNIFVPNDLEVIKIEYKKAKSKRKIKKENKK